MFTCAQKVLKGHNFSHSFYYLFTETKQCGASGDPHYQTFDSVRFDFQGECRYFFVQNCKDQDPYFDVMQQNQKDVRNQKVAFTSEIWIHFYDTVS